MEYKPVAVICPECKCNSIQSILIEDGFEILTHAYCSECNKEFKILPDTRNTLCLPPFDLNT